MEAYLQRVLMEREASDMERLASVMAECESSMEKKVEAIEKNIARMEVGMVAAKDTTLKTAATGVELVVLGALLLAKAEAYGQMDQVLVNEVSKVIQITEDQLKERDQAHKLCEAVLENKKKNLVQAQAILGQVRAAKRKGIPDNIMAMEEGTMHVQAILRMVSDLDDATGGEWREC